MFEVKGHKAQWEIVTDVLETKNIGDIATYEEILEALGPGFSRSALSSVVGTAIRKFRDRKRTFENVRLVGWRMVEATEHLRLARRQQVKSKRRLAEAVSISASTDLRRLDPEQRRAQQAQELHLRKLLDRVSRLEERQAKTETRVSVVEKAHASTQDRVDRLTDLLKRHGITEEFNGDD